MKTRTILAALLISTLAGTGLAGTDLGMLAPTPTYSQTIELLPTLHGREYGMDGKASIVAKGDRHTITVSCTANKEEDGETYVVIVQTAERKYIVGTVTMILGTGALRADYRLDETGSLPPVQAILGLQLESATDLLMEGWFDQPVNTTGRRLPIRH